MVDGVEETLDVSFDYPGDPISLSDSFKGSVTTTARAKAMGRGVEFWFQNGFHYHQHRLLNDLVPGRSNS